MSRSDIKEVGEMLDNSEAALIVVGEATIERAVDDATSRAKKQLKKEIRADAKERWKGLSTRRSLQEATERRGNGAAQRTDPRRTRQPYGSQAGARGMEHRPGMLTFAAVLMFMVAASRWPSRTPGLRWHRMVGD